MKEGKLPLHWYISMSKSKGKIVDVVFGLKVDRVFTFYKDSKPHMGAVRVEQVGSEACKKGQFVWYYMEYSASPSRRKVVSSCWGKSGDIPLVPAEVGTSLKLTVVRVGDTRQTAYVRDFAVTASENFDLGPVDSIPGVANFFDNGSSFFWHKREMEGKGDSSFVDITKASGGKKTIQLGISKNVIIRPDGTVIQPDDIDRFGRIPAGKSPCSEKKTRGYLWKLESEDTGGTRAGRPLILFYDYDYYTTSDCLQVLSKNYQQVSCLGGFSSSGHPPYERAYEGYGCGLNEGKPCYDRNSAEEIAERSKQMGGTRGGYVFDPESKLCFEVPDYSKRTACR